MLSQIQKVVLALGSEPVRRFPGTGLPELLATTNQLLKLTNEQKLLLLQKDAQRPGFFLRFQGGLLRRNPYQVEIAEAKDDYYVDALRMFVKQVKKRKRAEPPVEYAIILSAYDFVKVSDLLENICFWEHVEVPRKLTFYKYDAQYRGKLCGIAP